MKSSPLVRFLSFGLLGGSVPCWAQFASSEHYDFFELSLEELMTITVDVSTGTSRLVKNSPSSVSVYTKDEMQRMGVETLDQLLNFVPGFQMSRTDAEGGVSVPSVRGRQSNTVGREVLVLLDGARLNDPITGGVFSQDRQITLENIQQVEIIRGPGSALYGANAFSAVINLISDRDSSNIKLRAGSHNAQEAALQWSHQWSDLSVSLFAQDYQDHGEHYPAFYDFQGQFEPTQDPIHRTDFYLQGRFKGFSAYYRLAKRTNEDFISGGAQAIDHQRIKTDNELLRVSYQHEVTDFKLLVHGEQSSSDYDTVLGLFPENPVPDPTGSPLYWTNSSQQLMVGGNIRTVEHERVGMDASWQLHPDHLLSFGGSWMKEENSLNPFQTNIDIDNLAATGQLVPTDNFALERGFYIAGVRYDLLEPGDRISKGLYLQDEWRVVENLSLTAGLRHDKYDDFGSHNSYRGGMVYSLNRHTFKLLYGEAFRAPSFAETRAGIASGGISNPDLKPEEVDTYELSWHYQRDMVQSTLTLFHNHYENLVKPVLVDDVVPGFTAFQPQNVGQDEVNGLEYELDVALSDHLLLRSGYTHIFKTIDSEPVSDNLGFFSANYHRHPLNLNLSGYYHDEVLSTENGPDGKTYLDDYWIFNASMQAEVTPEVALRMDIYNLGDVSYRTRSPQQGLEEGLPARGRTALVGVTVQL
ncbi:TonB-dependent receptor plug domain-containing protein [Litoribrevibacter albus]|uniref:Catecholate siderophore receptor CirA n=1 Tax=Litoribrevibacter albus TaxID=1473156 RepID=A0AA37S8N0_9GAMM|nr:TonB-dependent receptor [Litoribrevibacter albus]GLQ31095.1 catecholate siderophore receptor CirA [Litoribrevibacter albus]